MGATRNLLSYTANRLNGYPITLNYSTKTLLDDGSFLVEQNPVNEMAYVVDLSEDQIQRLQNGGITVNNGISVMLPKMITQIPDSIVYGQDTYTILQNVLSEDVSIFLCGKKSLGAAIVEVGA